MTYSTFFGCRIASRKSKISNPSGESERFASNVAEILLTSTKENVRYIVLLTGMFSAQHFSARWNASAKKKNNIENGMNMF